MLSPCRTSTSSLRALVAANKAPQLVVAPGKVHRETTWSSSSSAAASTSRCGPSTTYRLLHSSTKRTEGGRSRPIQSNSLSPAVDLPITPKAAKTVEEAQAWLRHAFPGLPLPDDIAMMMITHESWDHGVYSGHNRRLSFLGRRAMKFYLSLFLSTHTPKGEMLTSEKVNDLLHTSKLGESAGLHLKLADVMRWTPAISDGQQGGRATGLYKIRGITVEALVGAIYHQHGAQAARAFFLARILPNLGTFSAREAEQLKEAIDREAELGADTLRNIGRGTVSAESIQTLEQVTGTDHTARGVGLSVEQQSSTSIAEGTSESPLDHSTRRRGASPAAKSTLSLDETEASSSSERRSIA